MRISNQRVSHRLAETVKSSGGWLLILSLHALACSGDIGDPASMPGASSGVTPAAPSGTAEGGGYTVDAEGNVRDAAGNLVETADGVTVDDQGNLVDAMGMVVAPAVPAAAGAEPGAGASGTGTSVMEPAAPSAESGETSGVPGTTRPFTEPTPDTTPLEARAWKLTHLQYARAVAAFLGVEIDVTAFETEIDNGFFPNMSEVGRVTPGLAQDYYDSAEAAVASLSDQQLLAFVPGGTFEVSSRDGFLQSAISRAFRRPSTPEDVTRWAEVFDLAVGGDASQPFRVVLRGLLTSPHFLYRTEVGATSGAPSERFSLTDHEIASLLSFSLLGEPPGAALLTAAEQGELTDPARRASLVAELLNTPEAARELAAFLAQWLEIHHFDRVEKFEDIFPGFTAVKSDVAAETEAFLAASANLGDGSFLRLLTDPVPETSAALTAFYGSDPSAGAAPQDRRGILGLGTVLSSLAKANLTSPTLRGLFVRDRILCQHIELPPGVNPDPLSVTQERDNPNTTRELYEAHVRSAECVSCHEMMDPLGFTMESFDGAGRYRTLENGYPIDTSGALISSDVDTALQSSADLTQALAASQWAKECFVLQAHRFYLGVHEASRGASAVLASRAAMGAEGHIGQLVAGLLSSDGALQRVRE